MAEYVSTVDYYLGSVSKISNFEISFFLLPSYAAGMHDTKMALIPFFTLILKKTKTKQI